MKTHKLLLFLLTGQLLASGLAAQTADSLVSAGRACLVAHNLAGAYSNFNAAVTLSPTNEAANALVAITRILVLPQQPAGSNFLNSLKLSTGGRDIYNWTSTFPHDINSHTMLPTNNTSEAIAFYRTNIMVALAASRTNLAQITDPNFTLSLTKDETSIESVTVDYGDFLLMQALERVAEFAGYTLTAHNFNFVFSHLQDLDKTNGLTIQKVLSDYPSLLNLSNTTDLATSKGIFTNAIVLYQQASDFIRNARPPGAVRLFNLETNDLAKEATFRANLTNFLLSLNAPTEISPSNANAIASTAYLGAYFAGTHSLRSLIPQFNGNAYVNDTLPDYTFGGIVPDWPAYQTEAGLRNMFHSYAGIYGGQVYDINYNDPNAGVFDVFISTNGQATVVGYDFDSFQNIDGDQSGGVGAQFNVDPHGNWQFNSNSVAGVSGYGSVSKDGSFYGELDFTNGDSVQLNGGQQSLSGSFQNAAGNYSGTWSGTYQGQPVSGTLKAVLSANGQLVYCLFHNGAQNDGGQGQFDSNNQFTTTDTASGNMISGTLNSSTFQITGTATAPSLNVTWTLNRSAKLPFDVPPVITTPPQSKIVPLGTNVTFSLVATGSPPMCYQWYFNGIAISNATTNTLVVTNFQYSSVGTYSVTINNVVGEADATASLLVSSPSTAMFPVATNANVVEVSFGLASDGTNYLVGFSSGTNICAQLLSSNGTRIGSALTIGGGAGVLPPQAQVVSGSTNYLVVSSDTTISSGVDIFGQFISRSGAKIGSKFPLLQSLGSHGFQAIESLASDGTNYLVVWMDEANLTGTGTSASYGQLVTAAGALSGSEFVVAQVGAPNPAVGVTVAFGKTNYLATWQSGYYTTGQDGHYTTYGAFVSPGGAVGDTFPISQTDSPDNNFSPGMAFDGANYLVVWSRNIGTPSSGTNNQWTQYGRLVSPNGTFPGNEVLMSAVWSMMPSLAFDGSNYLMAWSYNTFQTSRNIHFRFFDRSANPLGTEFVLFSAQGTNAPLSPWNGVIFDGKQYAIAATLGVLNVINNKSPSFPSAQVYAAFLPASGGATTPTILVQPLSQTNATGTVATFTVTAAGLPPLGCQWQKNGTNLANGPRISGANASSLTVSNLATTDAGNYSVIVGNCLGNATSSNAVLTVFIPDTTKPTSAITAPTSGLQVGNAYYTVTGTAGDNVAVSNVWYQLNNTGWNPATSANQWTNWTAPVTLIQGSNTIQAYAVDTSGNVSTTNTVIFDYIVSGVLTVNTNGKGTVSPNYNGTWLQIGQNYSMTATAAAGFAFVNWTGSIVTNGATLQFTMASNLTFTANFADVAKPTNTITAPTAGQRWSNSTFTVTGTASDNVQVAGVWYQLNGSGWNNAVGTTSWSALVNLLPGTNQVQAYAVDSVGNKSTTNSVNMDCVVTNQLQVRMTGLGTISPNYSNAWLEIGRNYTTTATAATNGFAFTNWVTSTNWIGGTTTTKTNLPFMMASNLTLQVTFADVTKPTLAITAPTAGKHMTNALATVVGTAGDNWKVSAVWYQLTNKILTGGTWSPVTTTNNYTNWTTTVTLAAGTNTVKAYAVDLGGNYSTTSSVSVLSSNTFELQLNFTLNPPLTSTGLNFALQISSNLYGHVQVSTNLTSWTTLTNFVGTNTTLNFSDPAATNFSSRFYRAVIP